MTNDEITTGIQSKISIANAEKIVITSLREQEYIETVRWYTFLQLEKDLSTYIHNMEWALDFFLMGISTDTTY